MRKLVIIISASILLSSCKKHEPHTLIYPIDGEEVMPCCTEFTWKGVNGNLYHFQLDTATGFTNPLVDTAISETNLHLDLSLMPAKTYYWQVASNEDIVSSQFRVRDIMLDFEGTYIGNIHYIYWTMQSGVVEEKDYQDTIQLTKVGDQLQVDFAQSPIDYLTDYHIYWQPMDFVRYQWGYGSNYCMVAMNYTNDSIFISSRSGGLGGGVIRSYKGKR